MMIKGRPIAGFIVFAGLLLMLIYLFSYMLISLEEFIIELLISLIFVLIYSALGSDYFIINDNKIIVKNQLCLWQISEYNFKEVKEIIITDSFYGIIGIKINKRRYSLSGMRFDKVCDSFIKLREKEIKVTV